MTVTVVGQTHATGTATGTEPSGTTTNDLMIGIAGTVDAGGIALPAGWTQIVAAAPGTYGTLRVAYIVRGGSAPSLVWVMNLNQTSIDIVTFRGNPPLSIDASAIQENGASATQPSPSVVCSATDSQLFVCISAPASSNRTITYPASATGQYNNSAGVGDAGATRPVAAGATGVTNWTISAADIGWECVSVVVKDAGSGGGKVLLFNQLSRR